MRDANHINFLHPACHRPAAARGLADPDVVQDAGRRSRAKIGTEGSGRKAERHSGRDRGARRTGADYKVNKVATSRIPHVPHPSHHIQRGATGRASRKPAAGSADATLLSLPPASSPGSSEHPLAENHSRRHRAQSQRSRKPTIKARSRFNPWVSAVRHSFPPSSIPTRKDIQARTAGHDGIAEKSDFSSNPSTMHSMVREFLA